MIYKDEIYFHTHTHKTCVVDYVSTRKGRVGYTMVHSGYTHIAEIDWFKSTYILSSPLTKILYGVK